MVVCRIRQSEERRGHRMQAARAAVADSRGSKANRDNKASRVEAVQVDRPDKVAEAEIKLLLEKTAAIHFPVFLLGSTRSLSNVMDLSHRNTASGPGFPVQAQR